MSPSRKARRERCTLPGAEPGRARQGWQGRGRGAVHTHRRASGRARPHGEHLSVTQPGEAPAARSSALPGGHRSIPAAAPHRGGRREESGAACPGSIARERQRRLPGASPGPRSAWHIKSSRRERVLVHKGAFAASSHAGALQQVTLRELGTGKGL